jgi:hypothetical protein
LSSALSLASVTGARGAAWKQQCIVLSLRNASSSDKDSSIAGARPIALRDSGRKLLLTRVRLLESAA